MRSVFFCLTALFVLSFASTASAHHLCPDYRYQEEATIYASATQLFQAQQYSLRAGGDHEVTSCNFYSQTGERITGHFIRQPDFQLNYQKDANFKLMFRVQSACDSVLLVNTGAGNWYWDDDDAGNLDAQIILSTPSNGVYDIWVGTVGAANCDAILHLETFKK